VLNKVDNIVDEDNFTLNAENINIGLNVHPLGWAEDESDANQSYLKKKTFCLHVYIW